MNYCLIDESDPSDFLECEGDVLKTFFKSSGAFTERNNLELIRKGIDIEKRIKSHKTQQFNIVQFSAHGTFTKRTKTKLDYSTIIRRKGNRDIEIFRPDSIVRTGLKADLFLSTNCQTFNPQFIDLLKHYKGVSNFIAPVNSPYIGDTLVFTMMFYNLLLRKVRSNSIISDKAIIASFISTNKSYKKYNSVDKFLLFNSKEDKIFQ